MLLLSIFKVNVITQLTFTWSDPTRETLEKGVTYAQS